MSSFFKKVRDLRIVLQGFHYSTPALSFERERAAMLVRMARELEEACTERELEGTYTEDRLNEPRLISGGKPKHTTCETCDATIEYMPEHAKRGVSFGDEDGDLWVKCPRPGCNGSGSAQ
jgi:hypothetical protein